MIKLIQISVWLLCLSLAVPLPAPEPVDYISDCGARAAFTDRG